MRYGAVLQTGITANRVGRQGNVGVTSEYGPSWRRLLISRFSVRFRVGAFLEISRVDLTSNLVAYSSQFAGASCRTGGPLELQRGPIIRRQSELPRACRIHRSEHCGLLAPGQGACLNGYVHCPGSGVGHDCEATAGTRGRSGLQWTTGKYRGMDTHLNATGC